MGNREGLSDLLAYVNKRRGIDFSLYRHATVIRKLDLRLHATKTVSYAAYLEYLKSHPAEIERLVGSLTIKVTGFFRDRPVFEVLASSVIPEIMSRFGNLRIWSLGCASGEEPYSLAIIVCDLLRKQKAGMSVKIVGTDIDAGAMEKAVRGEYPEDAVADVRKEYVDRFFRVTQGPASKGRLYAVSDPIKSVVRFERDDILSGLGQAKDSGRLYHIVLCRNVMIYMNSALRERTVSDISGILHAGGYMIIGESETLPDSVSDRFTRAFTDMKIYRRKSHSP